MRRNLNQESNLPKVKFRDTASIPPGGGEVFFARLRPGLLTRYILREIAAPAMLALMVVGFVFVGNELRERSTALPFEYITWRDMALLMVCFLPTLAYYAVPTGYMMGLLLAFSRLSQDNEITAAKAAGIPVKRIVVPVIVIGALLSVASFFLQDWAQPAALRRINELIYRELPLRATLDVLPAGEMHKFGSWRIYIGSRDPETRTLKDIEILMPQSNGEEGIYYADTAEYKKEGTTGKIVMQNAHFVVPSEGAHMVMKSVDLPLPPISGDKAPNLQRLNSLSELLADTKTETNKKELARIHVEIGERVSLPLACLAVSFAAAPLAARALRSGRSYSFAIGFSILFVYFMLFKVLEPRSLEPLWEVLLRSVTPNIVLCAVGCWAIWRVDRI